MKLLVTGGAGFIGSHTCLALIKAGHQVVVIDNFSNSCRTALTRVREIAGLGQDTSQLVLVEGDIRSQDDLERAFQVGRPSVGIDAVIHFAGVKAVGESVKKPLDYWDINVCGTNALMRCMDMNNCRTLVFSSSCTIYGYPSTLPISEGEKIQPINPYGFTKAAAEQMLHDVYLSSEGWRIACLRYFNPVGAHSSGKIGEDPLGEPNNLFPYITQVAVGERRSLKVYGRDWDTPDGSGVRDYIHVEDLADGHLKAISFLEKHDGGFWTFNLGTGRGTSVLEVIDTFERTNKVKVPYEIVARRAGDAQAAFADPRKAEEMLGWKAHKSLKEMCADAWRWQVNNPKGYIQASS